MREAVCQLEHREGGERRTGGFALLMGLLILPGLLGVVVVGLTRSMTDLSVTNRFLSSQQAFYLAEAGLDRKLAEFRNANTDSLPMTAQGPGSYAVTVTALGGELFELASTGEADGAAKTLRMTVKRERWPFPVPSPTTMVGEGGIGLQVEFFNEGPDTLRIDGCDLDSTDCFPGLVMTTDQQWVEMSNHINSAPYFGDRVVGVQGDHPSSALLISGTYSYSAKFQPQNIPSGGLGYDLLNSLADYVKAHADPDCKFINKSTVYNRTLGTPARPKLCYVERPGQEVSFDGTTGAGVLVVKAGLHVEVGDTLDYQGLLVVLGPGSELELYGAVDLTGAVIMGTTEGTSRPELVPSGSGSIRYSSNALEAAMQLLAGWLPPYGSGGGDSSGGGGSANRVTIEAWQTF